MTKSVIKQHDIWVRGSASDDYFQRNQMALKDGLRENRSVRLFSSFIQKKSRVLEIGCANGVNLESIRRITGCYGYGIDPSKDAVDDGTERYPDLELSVGSAEKLAFEDHYFEAVIFGFCLYLIDRSVLMSVVSESDRVLKRGGGVLNDYGL